MENSFEVPIVQGHHASQLNLYKVREVIDMDSRYYLVGEYPRCSKCMVPTCPWNSELMEQLDPAHRLLFPAVLMQKLALDRKCVTLMRPRTLGNTSSYIQQALDELHSTEWARRCLMYLSDCQLHQKAASGLFNRNPVLYEAPPQYQAMPESSWFATCHSNDILGSIDQMKGMITSTYGRIH